MGGSGSDDHVVVGLVFVKWLLMYLSDDDGAALLSRMTGALRPSGHLFLHESCDPGGSDPDPDPGSGSAGSGPADPHATAPWSGEWLGATYRAYYRPASYYRELLMRVAGPHGTLTEHDLDSLYDTPEPSGQRAWLLTLHDAPESLLA